MGDMRKAPRTLFVLLVLLSVGVLAATTGSAAAIASDSPAVDPKALEILRRAVDPISSAKSFRVTTRKLFDVVQESGQKLQFGTRDTITLRRPDRITAQIEQDDGGVRRVYYNGDTLTMHDVAEKVYSQFPVPRTLDATLDFLELEVGATVPLADLLYSDLSHLGSGAEEAIIVGQSRVGDWSCDHLAFRSPGVDYQVWVEQGDSPRLRKLVITYQEKSGMPQFGAVFTSWEFDIKTKDSLFEFSAPEGVDRIPTLARPRAPEASEAAEAGEAR